MTQLKLNNTTTKEKTVKVKLALKAIGIEMSSSFTVNWLPEILEYVGIEKAAGLDDLAFDVNTNNIAGGELGISFTKDTKFAKSKSFRDLFYIKFNTSPGITPVWFDGTPTPKSMSELKAIIPAKYTGGRVAVKG